MRAFHNYLAANALKEDEAKVVLPVTLVGLGIQGMPCSPDKANEQSIQCAALSLSCIAHISHHAEDLDFSLYLSEFISKHHHILAWLTSFQRWFFGAPTRSTTDGSSPIVSESTMLHILTGFIGPFYDMHQRVDLTGHEFAPIVDPFLELWPMLLDVDWDVARPRESMMILIETVSSIIFSVLARSFAKSSWGIIDKLGGPSSIISICLAFTERYYLPVAQSTQKDPILYSFLGRSLISFLQLLFQCVSKGFISDLPSSLVLSRVTLAVQWLLQDRKHIIMHTQRPYDVTWTDKVVMLYCRLIANCPASGDDLALLKSFKLGIIKTIRIHGFSTSSTLEQDNQLSALIQTITVHSVFPLIAQHASRLMAVPISPRQRNPWENHDRLTTQFYQRAWNKACKTAVHWDICITCKRTPKDCELKLCGGCRVFKHCSETCQRISWKSGHRNECKLLQYCRSNHRLINTRDTRGLLYMSFIEDTIRQGGAFAKNVDTLLSPNNPLPPGELPLLHYKLQPLCEEHQIKKFDDYPEIFGDDIWQTRLIPMLQERIAAGQVHPYLAVLSLPLFPGTIQILSPLSVLSAIGVLVPSTRG